MLRGSTLDKESFRYFLQSICIIVLLEAVISIVSYLMRVEQITMPLVVGTVYAIIIEGADILVWQRVNKSSEQSQHTFFLAISGFRLLSILATLTICYIVVGRGAMLKYSLVTLAFYLAILIHHSIYFMHRLSSHKTL